MDEDLRDTAGASHGQPINQNRGKQSSTRAEKDLSVVADVGGSLVNLRVTTRPAGFLFSPFKNSSLTFALNFSQNLSKSLQISQSLFAMFLADRFSLLFIGLYSGHGSLALSRKLSIEYSAPASVPI